MSYMEVPEFKFLVNDDLDPSFLPTRGDSKATGWDVRAAVDIHIVHTQLVKIPLGIKCFAPPGWWLELRPRSSTFAKLGLSALYGVIDESYEGELIFACQAVLTGIHISKGDRIGQLVPYRRQEMKVSSVTCKRFGAWSWRVWFYW
jgi:dUTPase